MQTLVQGFEHIKEDNNAEQFKMPPPSSLSSLMLAGWLYAAAAVDFLITYMHTTYNIYLML